MTTKTTTKLALPIDVKNGPALERSLVTGFGILDDAAVGRDAQTAVAGAATSNAANVVVTSEALTSATTYALTLTNSKIKTTSILHVTAYDGTNTWNVTNIVRSAGSAVISLKGTSLTGTVKIHVSVLN